MLAVLTGYAEFQVVLRSSRSACNLSRAEGTVQEFDGHPYMRSADIATCSD